MKLITSAAYISQDFVTEIGKLPPSFLPIGNRRFFEHQLEALNADSGDLHLSVPDGYQVSRRDREYLESRGVSILSVPEGLSLGASVVYCWNCAEGDHQRLQILHGDTLLLDYPYGEEDTVSEGKNEGYYPRARLHEDDGARDASGWAGDDVWVLSGYFSFGDPKLLIRSIVREGGNFIAGLTLYGTQRPLTGVRAGKWLDLGHINTFFRSRSALTTERSFNRMKITSRLVTKSSEWRSKVEAEAAWFKGLPPRLQIYLPHLVDDSVGKDASSYSIEYLYLLPISDIFVYGRLPGPAWRHIFRACHEVLNAFRQASPEDAAEGASLEELDALYLPKTTERLETFAADSGFDIHASLQFDEAPMPSLLEVARRAAAWIPAARATDYRIVHGDFCFSNILHDTRVQSVRLIDPRGMDAGARATIFGDARYDVAKLYHSVVGMYDFIVADRFRVTIEGERYTLSFDDVGHVEEIQRCFRELFFGEDEAREREVLAMSIQLFLSMLPLHGNEPLRQQAMVANSLRLYQQLAAAGGTP